MKGIILVGGLGTRLAPMTRVTNKHLLPVGRFPMVYYPLHSLVDAGIRDIMIVTGGNNPGEFLELLHSGSEFGLDHLYFTISSSRWVSLMPCGPPSISLATIGALSSWVTISWPEASARM